MPQQFFRRLPPNATLPQVVEAFNALTDGLNRLVNGAIDNDNMRGIALTVTSSAANTTFSATHGLGYVPSFYELQSQSTTGDLYLSTTAWTTSLAYFKHSGSTVALKLRIW